MDENIFIRFQNYNCTQSIKCHSKSCQEHVWKTKTTNRNVWYDLIYPCSPKLNYLTLLNIWTCFTWWGFFPESEKVFKVSTCDAVLWWYWYRHTCLYLYKYPFDKAVILFWNSCVSVPPLYHHCIHIHINMMYLFDIFHSEHILTLMVFTHLCHLVQTPLCYLILVYLR